MTIQRRSFIATVGSGLAVGAAGCLGGDETAGDAPGIAGETLTLTTTTSTYDTGLLDELHVPFQDRYGVTIDTVPEGTGAALQIGRRGDADVVMVHARALEDEFMEDGYGVNRRDLMSNDFVIVGPADDPAGTADADGVIGALESIAETGSPFISRGDNSGTHTKELELWEETDVGEPSGEWYLDAGQGMSSVLSMTNQQGDYTLTDRGTYLSMRADLDLEIHVQGPVEGGSDHLANPYGIVAVNPAVHENVNYELAMAYIGFITGLEGQSIIEKYTVDDEQLFYPEALSEEPNFEQYVSAGWRGSGANGGDGS
ncbi:tungstate ABC transporter permease [Natrialba chahannaoensis JCM 10990]|uniref:Tungstate ABC transporter permease n=1 Tax=Natrialba chahannaoensis JCM 10990 TaxID=1227492 RepID=M0ADS7_9EURY|nr:substrate-binding domain-containing protein [Natrialba chahannaoensis]ELY96920.1 tungstate ABC transporter permease [Natrialba chahannaoensis JCM 10990]